MSSTTNTLRTVNGLLLVALMLTLAAAGKVKGEPASAPTAAFTGVSLKVSNATVPPGGMFQFQLFLTEPKPLSHTSTSPTTTSAPLGTTRGISINDPSGEACGTAVANDGSLQITVTSPNSTFGSSIDYPLLTVTAPVKADANIGKKYAIDIDPSASIWLDPTGQPYLQESTPGTLTIGGTLSISDVVPGGGPLPAGATVSILGMGFTPSTKIQINEVTLASTTFVSPNRIDVTLAAPADLHAKRVRATSGGETATYYSYLRTTTIGSSLRTLLNQTEPLFSQLTYTAASLPWDHKGTVFTGFALQNPNATAAQVRLDVLTPAGAIYQSFSFSLPARSKLYRDVQEIFPFAAGAANQLRITSSQGIQMMGLLGDSSSATVVPVIVSQP